jgi:hypothetical protein
MVVAENVDPANNNSQFAWAENAGWLNAEPAGCGDCGLTVTDTKLTGFVWAENAGWVNLNCQNNGTCAGPAGNWGVTNNGLGALAGYAWSENHGWINFSCTTNNACAGPAGNWGVSVNPATGVFSGNAWAENLGWISFSDTSPVAYKVQTAWPNSDGDGYTDSAEAGIPLCISAINDDPFDDAVANDGCPGGPTQAGAYSEAQFKIGTGAQDPCGLNGWPSDLVSGSIPDSTNALTIADLTSFITTGPPLNLRRLDKNPGQAGFDSRWDLTPGRGGFGTFLNIQDVTTLLGGTTGNPPMFGNTRAFGKTCPFPP